MSLNSHALFVFFSSLRLEHCTTVVCLPFPSHFLAWRRKKKNASPLGLFFFISRGCIFFHITPLAAFSSFFFLPFCSSCITSIRASVVSRNRLYNRANTNSFPSFSFFL